MDIIVFLWHKVGAFLLLGILLFVGVFLPLCIWALLYPDWDHISRASMRISQAREAASKQLADYEAYRIKQGRLPWTAFDSALAMAYFHLDKHTPYVVFIFLQRCVATFIGMLLLASSFVYTFGTAEKPADDLPRILAVGREKVVELLLKSYQDVKDHRRQEVERSSKTSP